MQCYWFGDVDGANCRKAPGDNQKLAERLPLLRTNMETFVPLSWEQALECGFATNRDDYIERLRSLCFLITQQAISSFLHRKDEELVRMVRVLDEIDVVINRLLESLTDWYIIYNPSFTRKGGQISDRDLVATMKKIGNAPLTSCLDGVESLIILRTNVADSVKSRALEVLPNSSALVGGLVAARLIARAGGLEVFAKMTSATVQVLGAESALFSHLQSGSPPPKHGIIFQHRRIHNAPHALRGRVARVLAGRLSIAAKLDSYRGTLNIKFIEDAQDRINRAGGFT